MLCQGDSVGPSSGSIIARSGQNVTNFLRIARKTVIHQTNLKLAFQGVKTGFDWQILHRFLNGNAKMMEMLQS